jgi:hypothetical protein
MVYLKSIAVAVLAFLAAAVLYVVILFSYLLRKYPPPPSAEVGLDLSRVVLSPLFLLVTLSAFALGFWLVYRTHG